MPDINADLCHDVVRTSLTHLMGLVERTGRFTYAHKAGDTGDVLPVTIFCATVARFGSCAGPCPNCRFSPTRR